MKLGILAGRVGLVSQGKEIFLSGKQLVKINSSSYFHKDVLETIEALKELGWEDEIDEVINDSLAVLDDYNNEAWDRVYPLLIINLIKHGYQDQAYRAIEKVEENLSQQQNDTSDFYWDGNLNIFARLKIAQWRNQLNPDDPSVKSYVGKIVSDLNTVPLEKLDKSPKIKPGIIYNLALLGESERVDHYLITIPNPAQRKYATYQAALGAAKAGELKEAQRLFQQGDLIEIKPSDQKLSTWSSRFEVANLLGLSEALDLMTDQIDDLLPNLGTEMSDTVTEYTALISGLSRFGKHDKVRSLLENLFYSNDLKRSPSDYSKLITSFGEDSPQDIFAKLFLYLSPETRLTTLFNGDFDNRFGLERFLPYLENSPQNLDEKELIKFSFQSLLPNKKPSFSQELISLLGKGDSDEELKVIEHSLLAFGSMQKIHQLFSILGRIKEPISIKNIDKYRSLLTDEELDNKISNYENREYLIVLAELQIMTEAKHLQYIDKDSLLKVINILNDKAAKISNNEYVSQDVLFESLRQEPIVKFLGHVLKQKTAHYNSLIHCIDVLKLDLDNPHVCSDVLQAIDLLGGITPISFLTFQKTPPEKRSEIKNDIRRMSDLFYTNSELNPETMNVDPQEFDDIVSEYITLLYKPVGLSSDKVKSLISQMKSMIKQRNLTEELNQSIKLGGKHFQESKGCYLVQIESNDKEYQWKEGKKLDPKTSKLANILTAERQIILTADEDTQNQIRFQGLMALIKQGPAIEHLDAKAKYKINNQKVSVLASVLSFIDSDVQVYDDFQNALQSNHETYIFNQITKLQEVFGKTTDNRYETGVVLEDQFQDNLIKWFETLDSEKLSSLLKQSKTDDIESLSNYIFGIFKQNITSRISTDLARVQNKMKPIALRDSKSVDRSVRFYVSKNIASFFGKAAAGICTAKDLKLFARKDHFHINLVDDKSEQVIGNVQAYILQTKNGPELMIRGVNPIGGVLSNANAKSYIEAVLAVGRSIVESSNLAGLVLSEPLGNWHADSNRPEIRTVLEQDYYNEENEEKLLKGYPITDDKSITKVYRQYLNSKYKFQGEEQLNSWQKLKRFFQRPNL